MSMGRLILLSCLVYGLLILGLLSIKGSLVALAIPLVIYLGAALVYGPGNLNLSATRTVNPTYVTQGTPVVVKLSIVNQGMQLEEVLIDDPIPPSLELVEGEPRMVAPLPPGGKLELSYTVRGRRGIITFLPVEAIASDPLGLFRRRVRLSAPAQLLIKPEVVKLKPVTIRPLRTHGFIGPLPARRGGNGVNFYGVRDYQFGDPQRRVNWKATARHDQGLYTNEFEQEQITDVGLILDARQQTDVLSRDSSLFEHSIRAAAALADVFLSGGHRVGLLIYGRGQEATFPGYGKRQRERILRSLAQARTGDNMALESLNYLPTRFFPARSQIVLVSPLSANDLPVLTSLRAHGYQVLVVSPDPVAYERGLVGQDLELVKELELAVRIARLERTLLLRKLQKVGIRVVDWPVDKPLNQVMHTALVGIPGLMAQQFRILGIEI